MKLLVVGWLHDKNREGLIMLAQFLKFDLEFVPVSIGERYIEQYDIIYYPQDPFDPSRYPHKKFIFGPHFSVFPDTKLNLINIKEGNCVYIQPCQFVVDLWNYITIPVKAFPFPVDIDRFSPGPDSIKDRDTIFIYYKLRSHSEYEYLTNFVRIKGLENKYKVVTFSYKNKYREEDYLSTLKKAKFGIVLGRHESQGFAIEEALSCNVPLLVWSVTSMNQETGIDYPPVKATTVPYWDERCGEVFTDQEELAPSYDTFISRLEEYKPRDYIIETLSVEPCAKRFMELL